MNPVPSADVNWLLSAITQSAAALIAIVGGLLVSRYVSLHAEQQGARRRADDLMRRLTEAETQLSEREREFDLHQVDEFLDDDAVFRVITEAKGEVSVGQMLIEMDADAEDLNRDVLEERFAVLRDELNRAVSILLSEVPKQEDHESWVNFKRNRELPILNRSVWEWVYDGVCDEKRRKAKDEAAKRSLFGSGFDHSDIKRIANLANSQNSALHAAVTGQHAIAHVNTLRERVDAARAEARALHQELRLAEELFNATRQPEGFGLALQVLTTLAILGMGVPVALMAFAPTTLPVAARTIVVALFFSGVAILLRFLFVYANYLRGVRNNLPSRLGGLLRSDKATATVP